MTDPHEPSEQQKQNTLWLLNAEGVSLCRMQHKATGEWRTIIMVAHRPVEGGAISYPVGFMMEDNELRSCLDDYELPAACRRESEEEFKAVREAHTSATDLVDGLMDRVFPQRKRD